MQLVFIKTGDGTFGAEFSERGLARLKFPAGTAARAERNPAKCGTVNRQWLVLTRRALQQGLAGKAVTALPPLDLSAGTDFQRQVWFQLCAIPPGKTMSYGAIAEAIGRPQAMRAVGQACGSNPIPILVPCHRVLAAQGLGGFSSGLRWKQLLLEREGWLGRRA